MSENDNARWHELYRTGRSHRFEASTLDPDICKCGRHRDRPMHYKDKDEFIRPEIRFDTLADVSNVTAGEAMDSHQTCWLYLDADGCLQIKWPEGSKSFGCVPSKFTALEHSDSAVPDDTPFDRLRQAILELPNAEQHKIYLFLYSLGHRV